MTRDELRNCYAKAGVCVDVNPDATDEDVDEWARMVAECMERGHQKKKLVKYSGKFNGMAGFAVAEYTDGTVETYGIVWAGKHGVQWALLHKKSGPRR